MPPKEEINQPAAIEVDCAAAIMSVIRVAVSQEMVSLKSYRVLREYALQTAEPSRWQRFPLTTERYLGCKQHFQNAVNDAIGLEPSGS